LSRNPEYVPFDPKELNDFIAKRKIRYDIAFNRSFQQRPLEPKRITQMTARHHHIIRQPQPHQYIAAKAFDQRQSFAGSRNGWNPGASNTARME
jgi:hypothetical protein